ncbi:TetR/AcrR family transcriptional regulator [Halalkalibacter hemicellulosilyticus]|uniref:Transcriptional regulator n=1 Tax=Halalkalibacter hemicellulosilyticusJCM 9152 TaxID=1236971 RepID=W4QCM6_9BACI|nr:TetR/AcrR family transcriptional regulator [Halalkalibacter hemicellulosilyticus]GAE29811.1 transcriptional regulator [Halalkalibacter hemicellulosilyticusJCM 9152]
MQRNKKQLILDGATKSFTLFGYKATTMDQVAKIAKVGKGTIYTYFSTKEELLKAIIEHLALEMREVANKSINPDASFVDNFNAALSRIVEFREKHELTVKLSQEMRELGTPAVGDALQTMEDDICQYIEGRIQKAIDQGQLRKCDPKVTAFLMFKMYINLVSDWKERHGPLSKEEVAQLMNFYFMEG